MSAKPLTSASAFSTALPARTFFMDYFPQLRSHYNHDFIHQINFELKMTEVIQACIDSAGYLSSRYSVPSQQANSGIKTKQASERARKQAIEEYYQEIREGMLERVMGTDWRLPTEIEGMTSKEMKAQSNAYRNAAIKAASTEFVKDKAGKAFGETLSKYSGQTINKFIKPDTTLNKIVGKGIGKEFKAGGETGWKIIKAEFHGMKKLIDKSVEGYAEIGEQIVVSKEVKQYQGFEPEYFEDNTVGKIAKTASDLIPVFSWCKTGVKAATNFALSHETGEIAKRMKKVEDKHYAAELTFNQDLRNTIKDDVTALNTKEIKDLINKIGLKVN